LTRYSYNAEQCPGLSILPSPTNQSIISCLCYSNSNYTPVYILFYISQKLFANTIQIWNPRLLTLTLRSYPNVTAIQGGNRWHMEDSHLNFHKYIYWGIIWLSIAPCLAPFAGVWFYFSLLSAVFSFVFAYVLLTDDHVNNMSYFPFMSIKKLVRSYPYVTAI
jgi:hypothetical protein